MARMSKTEVALRVEVAALYRDIEQQRNHIITLQNRLTAAEEIYHNFLTRINSTYPRKATT